MIVGYVRLSIKDDNKERSDSIINQMMIIKSYCEKNNYDIHKFYIDDGTSGINYDREGFNKLKSDIENGLISMVVVKDISRLGRETYESSYYITEYFKLHNVKFIAVDEEPDNDVLINLKSIINDNYVKEASVKRKQVALLKINTQQFIGPYAPFGYRISCLGGKRTLVINDIEANIVRLIFKLKAAGVSCTTIANRIVKYLSSENITSLNYKWNYKSIYRIIKNRVYEGCLVANKTEKNNYRDKKRKYIPRNKQMVIENVFPAIVSKELFLSANNMMKNYATHITDLSNNETYPVFCSKCNKDMHLYKRYKNNKYEYYYKCLTCLKTIFSSKVSKFINNSLDVLKDCVDKMTIINNCLIQINSYIEGKNSLLRKEKNLLCSKLKNAYLKKVKSEIDLDEFLELKKNIEKRILDITFLTNSFKIEDLNVLYCSFITNINLFNYIDKIVVGDSIIIYYKMKKE